MTPKERKTIEHVIKSLLDLHNTAIEAENKKVTLNNTYILLTNRESVATLTTLLELSENE